MKSELERALTYLNEIGADDEVALNMAQHPPVFNLIKSRASSPVHEEAMRPTECLSLAVAAYDCCALTSCAWVDEGSGHRRSKLPARADERGLVENPLSSRPKTTMPIEIESRRHLLRALRNLMWLRWRRRRILTRAATSASRQRRPACGRAGLRRTLRTLARKLGSRISPGQPERRDVSVLKTARRSSSNA